MLDDLQGMALALFTPEQWRALAVFLVTITLTTETVKRLFLASLPVARKRRWVLAVACMLAVLGSVLGYRLHDGPIPPLFWVFTATSGGLVASVAQKLVIALIAWKFPGLAAALEGKKHAGN